MRDVVLETVATFFVVLILFGMGAFVGHSFAVRNNSVLVKYVELQAKLVESNKSTEKTISTFSALVNERCVR